MNKPSERIKHWNLANTDSHGRVYSINAVADANDVRREMDALHERLERLERDRDWLWKFHHTHNAVNTAVVPTPDLDKPEPKQEPKCEHGIQTALEYCDRCHDDRLMQTEKRESLAEVLWDSLFNKGERTLVAVEERLKCDKQAQAAKDLVLRVIDKFAEDCDDTHISGVCNSLKKRIEAL